MDENKKSRLDEIRRRFNDKCEKNKYDKDSIHTLMICTESVQAVALFGDKYSSYSYVLDAMDKYRDIEVFIRDFINILVPKE